MTAFEIAITTAVILTIVGVVVGEIAYRAFIRFTTPKTPAPVVDPRMISDRAANAVVANWNRDLTRPTGNNDIKWRG